MAKQKDNTIWYMLIVALLIIILVKGNVININQVGKDTTTILQGEEQGNCNIWFDDYTVEVGDEVTGTINDGRNAICYLYWRVDDGGWTAYGKNPLYTDSDGKYTDTILATEAGTYYFRAICGSEEGTINCVTPLKSVIVKPVEGDDDGGGGDAFCTDTDGGNILNTYGVCTDASGTTPDVCPLGNGNVMISEAYCQDGVCAGVSTPCLDGRVCINGQCVLNQLPCESIWNPTEQTCADGLCDEGTCVFEPATIVKPARCSCE